MSSGGNKNHGRVELSIKPMRAFDINFKPLLILLRCKEIFLCHSRFVRVASKAQRPQIYCEISLLKGILIPSLILITGNRYREDKEELLGNAIVQCALTICCRLRRVNGV